MQAVRRAPPGPDVLEAFALAGTPRRLPGGQGTSWRVDGAVLKPTDADPETLAWHAGVLQRLDGRDDLRVSAPLPTVDGRWSHDGWTASRYEPGEHVPGSWSQVIAAGEVLHAALALEPRPAVLGARTDPWAIADRIAWGEQSLGSLPELPHVSRLLAARRRVRAPRQLVHGDLSGNVLLAAGLPPLVIDLSPYWRPAAYASAIVVADALLDGGAAPDDVLPLLPEPEGAQLLLRALLFRATSEALLSSGDGAPRYRPAVELAAALVAPD